MACIPIEEKIIVVTDLNGYEGEITKAQKEYMLNTNMEELIKK